MQDFQDPTTPVQNTANDQTHFDPNAVAQQQQQTQSQVIASSQSGSSQLVGDAPAQVNVFDQSQVQSDRPLAAMNAMMSQVAVQPDPLNPAYPSPSSVKEKAPLNIEISEELPSSVQSVEQLRTPEISPEVEKYIEEVREEPSQFPHEVVLADQKLVQPANGFIAQPVIVLPMTQEEFQDSAKAPPDTSRRWLHEWVDKIRKIFIGSALFREELTEKKAA